jgi:hypothetical protein
MQRLLSLTAQAFLFTIALGPDTQRLPRSIACLLSLLITFLTVHLLTRHRQAEITDARMLESWEEAAHVTTAHGGAWRARRNVQSSDAWFFTPLEKLPGYRTWAVGLSLFGVAALAILVVTWLAPGWLSP